MKWPYTAVCRCGVAVGISVSGVTAAVGVAGVVVAKVAGGVPLDVGATDLCPALAME